MFCWQRSYCMGSSSTSAILISWLIPCLWGQGNLSPWICRCWKRHSRSIYSILLRINFHILYVNLFHNGFIFIILISSMISAVCQEITISLNVQTSWVSCFKQNTNLLIYMIQIVLMKCCLLDILINWEKVVYKNILCNTYFKNTWILL